MNKNETLVLAWNLSSSVWGLKIDSLLLEHGLSFAQDIKCLTKVFADLKICMHPKITGTIVRKFSDIHTDFISIHASSGKDAILYALDNAQNSKIIAFVDVKDTQTIYGKTREETAWDLTSMCYECGVHGIYCNLKDLKTFSCFDILKFCDEKNKQEPDFLICNISSSYDPIIEINNILNK